MGFFYRAFLRPLLFLLPPETVHHLGLTALRLFGNLVPSRPWDPRQQVTVGTGNEAIVFPSPIGLAAGFDKDALCPEAFQALGFGFVEVGTVTPRPQPGNPKPRLFRFPGQKALINRLGFNNAGAPAMARRLARFNDRRIPVGVNIGKNKDTPNENAAADYLECLRTLFTVADFFVVNVSSPNTPGLRELQAKAHLLPLLCALREETDRLCRAQARAKRPLLFVKVSPDENSGEEMVDIVLAARFDGIVATNTTRARDGLPPDALPEGGLSGAPLRSRSTDALRRLAAAARGRLTLIGVGGVFNAQDAQEKLEAGAALVEIYTGFVYGGPSVVWDIQRKLIGTQKKNSEAHA